MNQKFFDSVFSYRKLRGSFLTYFPVFVVLCLKLFENINQQGGHKPGKPEKLREFINYQNLTENSGKFDIFFKEKSGKLREDVKYVTKSLLSCSGKNFKMPWKSQGKLREFCFSKMWPPLTKSLKAHFSLVALCK